MGRIRHTFQQFILILSYTQITSSYTQLTFNNTLLKSDVTRRDHMSVVMDAGSRIVNFIVNFICDGTVFA